MRNPFHPQPAPPGFGGDQILPREKASLPSKLIFSWLSPMLSVGFTRPLEKEDLWVLPEPMLTESLSGELERTFYARCPDEKRPRAYRDKPDVELTVRSTMESFRSQSLHADRPDPLTRGPTHQRTFESLRTIAEDDSDAIIRVPIRRPTMDSLRTINAAQSVEKFAYESTDFEKDSRFDHVKLSSMDPDNNPPPETQKTQPAEQREKKQPKQDSSLLRALNIVFFWNWWISGALKLTSDTLKTTTPLVSKLLLTWLTNSFVFYKAGPAGAAALGLAQPQGIGYGIGLAFALFAMQEAASLTANHYFQLAMTVGVSMRTSIVGAIFRKSLRLSGRARMTHNVGQITTMISTDATRLDRSAQFMHNLWVAPIQIAIGIGLLLGNLGYSALVGVAVLVFGFPLQLILVKVMFAQRKKMVKITDLRVRLLTEVLQGIRLIKYYAWEGFYTTQITNIREVELETVRKVAMARGTLIGSVTILPVLAAVLSFITYALTGHDLNIAIIFSSLQFFTIIRAPLAFFPLVVANCADAAVALGRIGAFLTAEELADPYTIDSHNDYAVEVDGDFQWETTDRSASGESKFLTGKAGGKESSKQAKNKAKSTKNKKGKKGELVLPTVNPTPGETKATDADNKPFELKDLKLKIPRGAFVAIVGRVGSGKSSLLQALIGEMRKTKGSCVFSSSAAYVPQSAWIMNATLRDNIIFGREEDEAKLQEIVDACCLARDIEMLPNGELTEIGEKGINLSGGQKARVSLARAAYSGSDIVLMDDSLSAVDAYVGKAILDKCLLSGPLAGKTRVLVTHALHVLDKVDYIYVMDNGVIVEQGTFNELMQDSVHFSRVMEEYGTHEDKDEDAEKKEDNEKAKDPAKAKAGKDKGLMQTEERLTGAVSGSIYSRYFEYAGGIIKLPIILLLITGYQGSQVANSLFLGFWTASSIHGFNQSDYMGAYAATGVSVGVFAFSLSYMISLTALSAGFNMFKASLAAVLHSAVSFFDTTPMGRVMSRLSKDQDTVDTEISMTAYQLLSTFSSVVGTAGLVFYTFPYLGILFVPLSILYYITAMFYRRTSVETKRLDSLMRSGLYASYSETLTGLSTVRAYREQGRFIQVADEGLDMENRAYFLTVAIQRWLSVRLDLLGNFLILGIALFAACFRKTVDPSKTGVVLSYTLSITQVFSDLVSTYAQNEQNFNAVERVLHYTELPPEGERTKPNDPPPSWPERGAIVFDNVEMAYREGLPPVLKNVTFDIKAGEKVGVVGRTGAGKSSLLQVLFRFVNLHGGSVSIDGHNIADVGLDTVRSRLALVPQDSTLFLGTLRENLDPQATRTDAEIIEALKRSWLLPREGPADAATEAKFSLDAAVSDEGANYSAGEKQLLALCRALIKNSRVIVLDEATSNVDVETDAKLQRTIQTEFASSTLLCIAHRLNTIVYYDRILVMDAGRVAEFDTPLNLFDREGSIFRSLCDEAGLSRQDIVRIRGGVGSADQTH